jgi:hypothetical protein
MRSSPRGQFGLDRKASLNLPCAGRMRLVRPWSGVGRLKVGWLRTGQKERGG